MSTVRIGTAVIGNKEVALEADGIPAETGITTLEVPGTTVATGEVGAAGTGTTIAEGAGVLQSRRKTRRRQPGRIGGIQGLRLR